MGLLFSKEVLFSAFICALVLSLAPQLFKNNTVTMTDFVNLFTIDFVALVIVISVMLKFM